jgi:hypothetical protein
VTLIPDLQRDLVNAAGRLGEPRLPPRGRLAAGLATVAAVAALVLLVATRSDESSSPRESAAPQSRDELAPPSPDELPPSRDEPAPRPPDELAPAPELPPDPSVPPAPPDMHPIPGSSDPLEFEFGGVRYSVMGFRSQDSVCTALTEKSGMPGLRAGGRSCLSERLLRDALADRPVHIYAGGGGTHTMATGYARAEVAELTLSNQSRDARVVLSEPWSPEPWQGDPIRFVYILMEGTPYELPEHHELELRATLTNGDVVELTGSGG